MELKKHRRALVFMTGMLAAWAAFGGLTAALGADPAVKPASRPTIHLVYDNSDWYPFQFQDAGEGRGIHIDIVKKALENLGYNAVIEALPLARGIKMAEYGQADGVISVAYDKSYARFLEYPEGASYVTESQWRIMQVDEVAITSAESPYEFEGDIRSLPQPVRVFREEPAVSELKQAGLVVEESRTDFQNFSYLTREKTGSIVTTMVLAEKMDQDESFRKAMKIHSTPVRSRSYYLAFSWKSPLTAEERQRIWNEIARVRDDYVFMLGVFAQY